MDRMTMVRDALEEFGEPSGHDLSAFIEKKHGVKIEPKYIPIYKASIRDKQLLDTLRQERRATAVADATTPPQAV
jgi:hypothetical protein